MDIADSVIRNYRVEGTHVPVLMLINQCKFRLLSGNPFLVKFSPRRFIALKLLRKASMLLHFTDRLQIVYCLLNEIIGLLNVLMIE